MDVAGRERGRQAAQRKWAASTAPPSPVHPGLPLLHDAPNPSHLQLRSRPSPSHLCTQVSRSCPMRCTLPMACSSEAGSSCGSTTTTCWASVRVKPGKGGEGGEGEGRNRVVFLPVILPPPPSMLPPPPGKIAMPGDEQNGNR